MQGQSIPYGYCKCGCGQATRISERTCTEKGWVRGKPRNYINGHNGRKHGLDYRLDPDTGCWHWLGSKTCCGYGQGVFPGYQGVAHLWFYTQAKGPVPPGLQLDHLCRNRACVNPDHLEPVTAAENVRRGSATILTADQVREIKRAPRTWGSGNRLAERFGVHKCTISAIRHGRLWPDVT